MSLLQTIKLENKPAGAGTIKNSTFGLVLQVLTAEIVKVLDKEKKEVDSLKLTGTTLNGNSQLPEGSRIVVHFRDNLESAISNFKKGQGRTALVNKSNAEGSTVTLEACYLAKEPEDGLPVVNSRWVNTLTVKDVAEHANRSFITDAYATAPRISFDVPNPVGAEPKKVTFPVNAKSIELVVENEGVRGKQEFSREWAAGKLAQLKGTDNLKVTIDQVSPGEAVKIDGPTAFAEAMTKQLGVGTRALTLLRVTDGAEVITRAVYVPFKKVGEDYVPDVAKALTELGEKNIFRNVPNAQLWAAVESGGLTLEAIPGYRLTYAGNPHKDDNAAFKLVNDFKKGNTARYDLMFGADPASFAKVLLPGIARKDGVDSFSPTNVISDEPGTFAPTQLATKFIGKPAAPAAASEASLDDVDPEPDAGIEDHAENGPRP